ncbi:RNA-binding protein 48 [Nilaparvata lugens]|uniref:RNA-binding protein 48 n=1 Tax=Nilaparvata lugens TaxID=108931 RepID=UPI00193CC555|nr:RNA-binding protein 48 [Nilaparvata lugens]
MTEKLAVKFSHHEQQEFCYNRPHYRQGRKFTAVKVYTINDESTHLLIFDVPGINLRDELAKLVKKYGPINSLSQVKDYDDLKQFTELYHVNYKRIQAARYAKRQLDNRSFYGGILHVCYAPEYESVTETREKLIQRRREVSLRLRINEGKSISGESKTSKPVRTRKHPALPLTNRSSDSSESHVVGSTSQSVITPSASLLQERFHPRGIKRKHESATENELVADNKISSTNSSSAKMPTTLDRSLTTNEMKTLKFVPRSVSCVKRITFHKPRSQVP